MMKKVIMDELQNVLRKKPVNCHKTLIVNGDDAFAESKL